VSKLTQAVAR